MDKKIRPMEERDIPVIATAFAAQGWNKPESQYRRYFEEQQAGTRQVLILEADGEFAGYLTLLPTPSGGPWMGEDLPEISDFNVLMKFQGRGYGWALMDAVEELAAKRWNRVTLAVGLHNGYGIAQRMYVRRGYLPDGSGVWFGEGREPFTPYAPCVNDDSLVLYLSKELREGLSPAEKRDSCPATRPAANPGADCKDLPVDTGREQHSRSDS